MFIKVIKVNKSFIERKGLGRSEKKILDNVSVDFEEKTINTILGLEDSGKKVLLDIISGRKNVDTGKVLFDGKELNKKEIKELVYHVKKTNTIKNKTSREYVYNKLIKLGNSKNFDTFEKKWPTEELKVLSCSEIVYKIKNTELNQYLPNAELKKEINIREKELLKLKSYEKSTDDKKINKLIVNKIKVIADLRLKEDKVIEKFYDKLFNLQSKNKHSKLMKVALGILEEKFNSNPKFTLRARVESVYYYFNLEEYLDRKITNQFLRIITELMIATANGNKFILINKPFDKIEKRKMNEMHVTLNSLKNKNRTIILTSLKPNDLEKYSDKIIFIFNGKLKKVINDVNNVNIDDLYEKHITKNEINRVKQEERSKKPQPRNEAFEFSNKKSKPKEKQEEVKKGDSKQTKGSSDNKQPIKKTQNTKIESKQPIKKQPTKKQGELEKAKEEIKELKEVTKTMELEIISQKKLIEQTQELIKSESKTKAEKEKESRELAKKEKDHKEEVKENLSDALGRIKKMK